MPNANDSWGIEVGSNALKAIRLQRQGDDIALVQYEVIQYPKVLSTPDVEPTELIRDALLQFRQRHDMEKSTVTVSVPGNMAFARFAKLPPVEPKAVAGIVQYEAQQQIPFPIDQVEWDYQTFQFADSPDVEVGIFAITKDRVGQFLAGFHACQIPVHKLSLSPVSVYNGLSYDLEFDEDTPGTILMDIGTNSTDVIIVEQGRLWLRTIPIGGHHFTEALVSNFKLNYSKAEKIKREAATSKYARQIFQAMRPVFVDLVNEVQRSLGFYQTLNRDAELKNLVGMGSTFQLPGLKKFLKQQLSLDVSKLESFSRVKAPGDASDFDENIVTLSPAYGLALQGLGLEKVSCNLLPMALIRKQVWSKKKGAAVAAAAVVAASAALGYSRLWVDQQSYNSNTQARQATEQILKVAKNYQEQGKDLEIENDPRLKIENLRRTLDYRNVWPSILDDIAAALASVQPQAELISQTGPDGKTLKVEDRVKMIKAIPRPERRLVNIESIDYEYVPPKNATGFKTDEAIDYESMMGEFGDFEGGMPPGAGVPGPAQPEPDAAEEDKGPPPPAFNIVITGTTTKAEAPNFLLDTFINTLNKIDMEQGDKRDRPYRIKEVKLAEIVPMIGTAGAKANITGPTGGNPGGFGGEPGFEEEFGPGPGGIVRPGGRVVPGGRTVPGSTFEGAPGGLPGTSKQPVKVGNYQDYMPSDPLVEEDKQSDWRFTITWRVELLPPNKVRVIDQEQPTTPAIPGAPAAASAEGADEGGAQ